MRVVETYDIGARVLRGPDWVYENQDIQDIYGSEIPEATGLGTIIEEEDLIDGWAPVRWDTGYEDDYRIGVDSCFDLIYADVQFSSTLENVYKL